jgi:acetyl-CoA acetyltransferase
VESLRPAYIVGVGASPQGKVPGHSGDDLAIWALRLALEDAKCTMADLDGLAVQQSFGGGSLAEIGHRIGAEPRVSLNVTSHTEALNFALMAIGSGICETVGILYGTNQKTNRNSFVASTYHTGGNYSAAYGIFSPGATAALNYRRRMHDFGATEAQLGSVAIAQSKAAALNPLAVYRQPLTLSQYLETPYVIEPLRVVDFAMVSDGGFAIILSGRDGAARSVSEAVRVAFWATSSSFLELEHPDAMYHPSLKRTAAELWGKSSYKPGDIDLLYVQDAFTPNVLAALENYGFCEFGTAHEWISGGRIEIGGALPVNANGGQNRMTYMVGWQNTHDAVCQLRRKVEMKERRVECDTVMCTYTSGHWQESLAVIYDRTGL